MFQHDLVHKMGQDGSGSPPQHWSTKSQDINLSWSVKIPLSSTEERRIISRVFYFTHFAKIPWDRMNLFIDCLSFSVQREILDIQSRYQLEFN